MILFADVRVYIPRIKVLAVTISILERLHVFVLTDNILFVLTDNILFVQTNNILFVLTDNILFVTKYLWSIPNLNSRGVLFLMSRYGSWILTFGLKWHKSNKILSIEKYLLKKKEIIARKILAFTMPSTHLHEPAQSFVDVTLYILIFAFLPFCPVDTQLYRVFYCLALILKTPVLI